ncbi:hypothetical protein Tco_0642619 [Tanacetum coccineum]
MHNNIMAAGSRDRPPMLATGRYAQWRSRFLRYIDTRPNGDALRKCILTGPYIPTMVTTPAVPATEDAHRNSSQKQQSRQFLNNDPEEQSKEIAKPITPPSESASEEDSDPEQAHKTIHKQNNLALIVRYFKKLYKPTNNNLRTSSNTETRMDTTPRYKNDNQTGQFGNQEGNKMLVGASGNSRQQTLIRKLMNILEAHYSYMAKNNKKFPKADSGTEREH